MFAKIWDSPVVYQLSNYLFNWIGKLLSSEWDNRLLGIADWSWKTIIDIGANEGQFSRRMRRQFPHAQIYAFEPLPLPYRQLTKWAQAQNSQVTTYNLALGESVQSVEIHQHLYFLPSSSLLPTTTLCEQIYPMVKKQEKIGIPQSTLDREMQTLQTPLADDILIKLDVQGYEDRVIRGGRKTFEQAKACILEISLDSLYEGQSQFRDIFLLLDELGYEYAGNLDQVLARDGHVRYLNALFVRAVPIQ